MNKKSLGPVDDALGGQFRIRVAGREALVIEQGSFGVVREIFGQSCYVNPEELRDAKWIVDLGANVGVFTLFSLCHAPHAKVIAVEAQPDLCRILTGHVSRNGFHGRVEVRNALAGGACSEWARLLQKEHPDLRDLEAGSLGCSEEIIDFLKCDIEGAEYAFFHGCQGLLHRVKRLAIETHGSQKETDDLQSTLERMGFSVRREKHGTLGYLFGQKR